MRRGISCKLPSEKLLSVSAVPHHQLRAGYPDDLPHFQLPTGQFLLIPFFRVQDAWQEHIHMTVDSSVRPRINALSLRSCLPASEHRVVNRGNNSEERGLDAVFLRLLVGPRIVAPLSTSCSPSSATYRPAYSSRCAFSHARCWTASLRRPCDPHPSADCLKHIPAVCI